MISLSRTKWQKGKNPHFRGCINRECEESERFRQLFSYPLLFIELQFFLMCHKNWVLTDEKKKQSAEVKFDF